MLDVVAGAPDVVGTLAGGVLEFPVDVARAGDVGALVAAAHRHDDVGPLRERGRDFRRDAVGDVDVDEAGVGERALELFARERHWLTSSTSFANPAISVGRIFSDTFAGIAPASVPAFAVAQLAGGVIAIAVLRVLYPDVTPQDAADVIVPHSDSTPADERTNHAITRAVAISGKRRQPIRIAEQLMARVLFVCLHNAGRAQMSRAF